MYCELPCTGIDASSSKKFRFQGKINFLRGWDRPAVRIDSRHACLAPRPRFRHQRPQGEEAQDGDHRQSEERDRAAQMVAQIPRIGRADRSANSDGGADDSLSEIEMPGAPRDIGDDERHHDGEHRGGNAVEQLSCDQQVGIRHGCEQEPAQRQCGKSRKEQRPASPYLGLPSNRGRKDRDKQLRSDDACGDQDRSPIDSNASSDTLSHERKHRGVAEMEHHDAAGENHQRALSCEPQKVGRQRAGATFRRPAMGALGIDFL